jgi:hypothetical protein
MFDVGRWGAVDMTDSNLDEQRQAVYDALSKFARKRTEWYSDKRAINLKGLMAKDVVMFAARGVRSADEFVVEAFHAKESTSEETVMGTLRQEICAAVSADTLDTGDMTTLRDGDLYMCELKSQANTTNSSSFPQELRELRDKCDAMSRFRRASSQRILPAFCVMRNNKAIDEWRTYTPQARDQANQDLAGFQYRYLAGAGFWRWLIGLDSVDDLIEDFANVQLGDVRKAREDCIERLKHEMALALAEEHLGSSMNDVLELRRRRF